MASLKEYFETDCPHAKLGGEWQMTDLTTNVSTTIKVAVAYDFGANAKYMYLYIPEEMRPVEAAVSLYETEAVKRGVLSAEGDNVEVTIFNPDIPYSAQNNNTLVFSNKLYLYIDRELSSKEQELIVRFGREKGFIVQIVDKNIAKYRSEREQPLAFISHDSRDKEELVRELARKLTSAKCPVWYDEYSLNVGDSLRESIEKGLKEAKKCILVLSPHFLNNKGWGKREFDSVFTREIVEEQNCILPIWHKVTRQNVYEYSPSLADKVGISTADGVDAIISKLVKAIQT